MAASLLCYLSAWRLNQGICAWKAWKFPFWTRCQNFIWSKQFIGHFPGNRKGWMQIGSLTPDSSISNTCWESWEDRAKTNQPSLLILKGRIFLLVDFKNCSTLPCHVYTYLLPATSEETVISSFLKFSIVSVWEQAICLPERQIWRLEGCCLNYFPSHVSGLWNSEVLGLSRTTPEVLTFNICTCVSENNSMCLPPSAVKSTSRSLEFPSYLVLKDPGFIKHKQSDIHFNLSVHLDSLKRKYFSSRGVSRIIHLCLLGVQILL